MGKAERREGIKVKGCRVREGKERGGRKGKFVVRKVSLGRAEY